MKLAPETQATRFVMIFLVKKILKLKLKSSHYLCFRFELVVCCVITEPIGNAFYSCIRFANAVGSFEHFHQ